MGRGRKNRQTGGRNEARVTRARPVEEPELPPLRLTFVGPGGRETPIKMATTSAICDIIPFFAMAVDMDPESIRFMYHDTIIQPGQTMEDLGMRDGDIVMVVNDE